MQSGDGLLVRLRPPGVLTNDAARALSAAAARWGNGAIELTQRAAIQVRGLSAGSLPHFAQAMVAAGLADADPDIERQRRVVRAPLSAAVAAVADAIETAFCRDPVLAGLPEKFCIAVDGGAVPMGDIGADIVVTVDEREGRVALGGALAVACSASEAAGLVTRLAVTFLWHGARRMRDVNETQMFTAAGLVPEASMPCTGGSPVGWHDCGAFGVGVAFGATDAAGLADVAELAERFGDGRLHLTPWRAFLLSGVAGEAVPKLRQCAEDLGMVVSNNDPRLLVVACPGQPACASASVTTRTDAMVLAASGLAAHVSGCAKGCAHPAAAPVTLVGRDGRYDLVRHGSARDAAVATGLTIAQAVAVLQAA